MRVDKSGYIVQKPRVKRDKNIEGEARSPKKKGKGKSMDPKNNPLVDNNTTKTPAPAGAKEQGISLAQRAKAAEASQFRWQERREAADAGLLRWRWPLARLQGRKGNRSSVRPQSAPFGLSALF